jgi:hypothetical protein
VKLVEGVNVFGTVTVDEIGTVYHRIHCEEGGVQEFGYLGV